MSRPMPEEMQFYIEHKHLDAAYTMPTMEAANGYYELGYMISGDRMCITPTSSYTSHAGSVGTCLPFLYHRTFPLSDTPYESYLIKFKPDFVKPLTDTFGQPILNDIYSQPVNLFHEKFHKHILMFFQEMLAVFEAGSPYSTFRLQCMLCDFLLFILENRLPAETNGILRQTPLTPPIIDAIYYMEQHYNENTSLETIAHLSGYSPSHFSRLFHAQLGKSYTDYLTEIRLRHVQDLLLNTEKSITEIALETGYRHTGNLSSQFRKQTGMTPLQYRKAQSL